MGENRPRGDDRPAEEAVDERSRDENFLSRWSRLKRESSGPAPAPAPAAPEPTPEAAGGPEAEPPGDEDMPPLESLGPDADYSAFLSPRVSAGLRQKALRQLFRGSKFNVCDGLDVYAEDYTKFTPLGDVMTADLKHRLEQKLKKAAEKEKAAAEKDAALQADASAEEAGESPAADGAPPESGGDASDARSAARPEEDDDDRNDA